MQVKNFGEELKKNSYPGRGIMIGKTADGKCAAIAYFIMGRSVNSRNRVFVEDGEGIRTQAFDPAKLSDPSLVIYAPVRVLGSTTIVTNGDQTDTVYDFLRDGKTFSDALFTRTFEPDAPNYTPRISALVETGDSFSYQLSILKSADGDPDSVRRFFFDYQNPQNGVGHFLHTYRCDGDPIPSFEGEPEPVAVCSDIDAFTTEIWDGLNADNKVSLFTRFIDLATGKTETRIVNKNQ
ncbi:MAG TPA: IMP cyclohydrolase [Candidatus Gallacutalibacter pullicola]|uniref:IMP cyclohydrolase n=1 Tax=Candidatus Gallacutalibacter pullicola TaxID=2840830 RepID=A0A9D1DQG3_9FIRM|nr:IMP cyclohydrolase [Candidatus Gallacutalibacter pullicola]